nr:hypothetical protein [Tanacetum cinerariifolium]
MTYVLTFVATRLRQQWRAILSVLNRKFKWQAVDRTIKPTKMYKLMYTRFTKLIIDHFLSCNKNIPRRPDSDMQSEGQRLTSYQTNKHCKRAKKAKSKKAKATEEPEDQHVSLVKSGRGKGYMRLGDQQVNVPSVFNKNVVPRKPRSLIVSNNIVEEPVAVELAKSISHEDQRRQQCSEVIDLAVQSLLDLRKGSKASRLENIKQMKKAVAGEGSNTNEAKDDDTDDFDESGMDLSEDEPKGDDDALEALTSINVAKAIDKAVYAKVLTKMKKLLPTHVLKVLANYLKPCIKNSLLEVMQNNENIYDTLYDSIILDQKALDALNAEPSFHKRSHDHQDPSTDRKGEKKKKRQKDAGQSYSKSSRKYKALMVRDQEDNLANQPQDQEDLYVQEHPNAGWFTKKSRSANATKRRTIWLDLLLKLDIDQNKNDILGPSTVAIAKKLKELIYKDELTIAYVEGA